jgi:hypothetical protein
MYWRVALLILLTMSVPQAKAEPSDEQALRLLNHYHQLAGLGASQARSKAQRGVHGGYGPRNRRRAIAPMFARNAALARQ